MSSQTAVAGPFIAPSAPLLKGALRRACKSVFSSGGLHSKNWSQIKALLSKGLWVGWLQDTAAATAATTSLMSPFPPVVARPLGRATFIRLTASWRTGTQSRTWHEIGHKSRTNGRTIPKADCDQRSTEQPQETDDVPPGSNTFWDVKKSKVKS